jgi:hypothetical protein
VRTGLILIALLGAAAGTWEYWSPRSAVHQLHDAAQRGDTAALERLVDFPEVRRHMRLDIDSQAQRLRRDTTANLLAAGLAAMLGVAADNGLIDSLVSARSIATLARLIALYPAQPSRGPKATTNIRYRDLSHVVVVVRNRPGVATDSAMLTLERQGLSWRLVRVNLSRLLTP